MIIDQHLPLERHDRLVAEVLRANDIGDLDGVIMAVHRLRAAYPVLSSWCSYVEAGWYFAHGREDEALVTLRRAQQDGAWWSARILRDPDLQALWAMPEAAGLISLNTQRIAAAGSPGPHMRVSRSDARVPNVNVVVLHGNAPTLPDDVDSYWDDAASVIIQLRSSQVVCEGVVDWSDTERGHQDISLCLEKLDGPVLMAGLGAGGQLAIESEWRHPTHPIIGSIAISPSCQRVIETACVNGGWLGQRPVRIHAGGKHGGLAGCQALSRTLRGAGVPVQLTNHPEVGRSYPTNATSLLRRDVVWLIENCLK